MVRTCCRGCDSRQLKNFLDLGCMPLAGEFLSGREAIAQEKSYPLSAHTCEKCGLVQILEVIDPEILFQDYSFSSSTVGPLVDHFEQYARWLKEKFNPKSIVEFGCNDGVLLSPLEKLGIKTCGVDISRNITDIAASKGLNVLQGYFNEETAQKIRESFGPVDIITGSNTFAHNDTPETILNAVCTLLQAKGYLCLEVMYAGDLLELVQWDTLYHEHLTFYCLSTLAKLLGRYDFQVVAAERIPMHGGSLRVAATRDPEARVSESVGTILSYEKERKLDCSNTWVDFGKRTGRKIDIVKSTLGKINDTSRIWGYGAAGKSTLWVNACAMNYLEAMVDASPLRAGKLMPGTHTPIVFPSELKKSPPDYIFVSAWNYADLIRSKEAWYNGVWVTPLPELRFF